MVEPIFEKAALMVLTGTPAVYDHVSEGSGKRVHVHFCKDCGTKLWLGFERFPDAIGVYAGTFDDPCWFSVSPEASKHIYLAEARSDTVIPPGIPTFMEHAMQNDGTPNEPTVFASPHRVGG